MPSARTPSPATSTSGSARSGQDSVALSLCSAAHPLYTIFTNIFGASISEATMRPNPRSNRRPAPPASWRTPATRTIPARCPCRRSGAPRRGHARSFCPTVFCPDMDAPHKRGRGAEELSRGPRPGVTACRRTARRLGRGVPATQPPAVQSGARRPTGAGPHAAPRCTATEYRRVRYQRKVPYIWSLIQLATQPSA